MPSPTVPTGRGDFGRGRPITPDLRAARRNVLIESAYAVLTERGYERTAMSDIAKHAGVGQATVYRYFDSKRELVDDVFDFAVLKIVQALDLEALVERDVDDSEQPASVISELGRNLFALVDNDPAILRLISVESSAIDAELRYRVMGLFTTLDDNLVQLFERHAPDLGADSTAVKQLGRLMLGSALPGLLMSMATEHSEQARAEFLSTMESIAVHGIFGFTDESSE